MVPIRVYEATVAQLNWLVTFCEMNRRIIAGESIKLWVREAITNGTHADPYATDIVWMWPVILREGISLRLPRKGYTGTPVASIDRGDGADIIAPGSTPLVAAARCYVAYTSGGIVDIPDVLA